MSERGNCNGCPTGGNMAGWARVRIACELGITCTGSSRANPNVSLTRAEGFRPAAVEISRTRVGCPLVYRLESYLSQSGVDHKARDGLLSLMLTGAISPKLPLAEAIREVVQKQEDPEFTRVDSQSDKPGIDVDSILRAKLVPTQLQSGQLQHYVNGLNEPSSEFTETVLAVLPYEPTTDITDI